MKRIATITTIIIGAALVCSCGGLKKMPGRAPVTVEAEENLIPKSGELPIVLTVNVPEEYRNLNNGIQVRPAIVDKKSDRRLELEPMVIEGKYNKTFNERMDIYRPAHGDSIDYRIPYQKGNTVYKYETTVPYEGWFASSGIEIDLIGEAFHRRMPLNATNVDKEFTDYAEGICLKPYEKYYFWEKPDAAEEIHSGEQTGSGTFVTFPLASADMGKNEGKAEFETYLDKILHHPEVKDYSLAVTIANSPEGSLKSNEKLSATRKAAVEAYLGNLNVDASKVNYTILDENWNGLAESLPALGLEHQDEILTAIDTIADVDAREHLIRDTYYKEWNIIRKELYPMLRLADITVAATYKGKDQYFVEEDGFTFEEDPVLDAHAIHEQLLEALKDKNYELAGQLADQIPNSGVPDKVLSNKATVYLMNGRLEDARILLERIPEMESSKINLGMIYLQQQKYKEAEEILEGTICTNAAVTKMYAGDYKAAADILNQLPATEQNKLLSKYVKENLK